jgi:hypothetical protein
MRRPCIDCGTPTPADRCDPCRLVRNRKRLRQSSNARGYGKEHKQARTELLTLLPAYCGYGCGLVLLTPADMVAAHVVDGDPEAGWIASCRSCNERAKGRRVRS